MVREGAEQRSGGDGERADAETGRRVAEEPGRGLTRGRRDTEKKLGTREPRKSSEHGSRERARMPRKERGLTRRRGDAGTR